MLRRPRRARASALLVLLVAVIGGLGKSATESVESRIDAYTRTGSTRRIGDRRRTPPAQGMTAQAVGIADKALESNRGFEVKLGDRLDAAGDVPQAGRVAADARRHRLRRRLP